MHELKIFESEEFGRVRTLLIEGEPWFVGKDVASILQYSNTGKAILSHVDEDDRKMATSKTHSQIGNELGQRGGWIINESGLYSLILSSKLPTAKKFKRWVTGEVLPSIRKYGMYMTDEALLKAIRDPKNLDLLVEEMVKDKREKKILEEKLDALEPKSIFFDNFVLLDVLTSIRDTANEMKIKPMRFTQFLLDNKYVYRKKNQRIFPHQQYVHDELFEVKDAYNCGFHYEQTCITVKGKLYFLELLKKREII